MFSSHTLPLTTSYSCVHQNCSSPHLFLCFSPPLPLPAYFSSFCQSPLSILFSPSSSVIFLHTLTTPILPIIFSLFYNLFVDSGPVYCFQSPKPGQSFITFHNHSFYLSLHPSSAVSFASFYSADPLSILLDIFPLSLNFFLCNSLSFCIYFFYPFTTLLFNPPSFSNLFFCIST